MKTLYKDVLTKFYENNLIPAIVLGCMTALSQGAVLFLTSGVVYCTFSQAFFAFLFFVFVMAADSFWNFIKYLQIDLCELDKDGNF